MEFVDARPAYEWLSMRGAPLPHPSPDVFFILGGGSETPLFTAAELYKRAPKNSGSPIIAFASLGGNHGGNLVWGNTELAHYNEVLLKLGVPRGVIFYPESESEHTGNTLDEARVAIPFLARCLGKVPSHVVLCARPVHQRRAFLTFKKQHPTVHYRVCPGDEPLSVELLPRIAGEIRRIREYAQKGDIEECAIPPEVLVVEEKLRAAGITG